MPKGFSKPSKIVASALAVMLMGTLCGCGGGASEPASAGEPMTGSASSSAPASDGSTSGPPYQEPTTVATSTFDEADAVVSGTAAIDVSTASQGYVGVSAQAQSRLKFQVITSAGTYNYDLPQDGTPIIVPLNMGDGAYEFRVMQNTTGSSYVQIAQTTATVQLANEFEPYLHPNLFCDYTPQSACVTKARELAAGAQNEGDVARAIYTWLVDTITYDDNKAASLADATGYVPSPDATLASQTGICFDYASLAAAMFRSLGIPCQIITGYVSPDDVYHAWNMIYIDGEWVSASITIEADKWCRIDTTFAAAGAGQTIGNGQSYTDRYVY